MASYEELRALVNSSFTKSTPTDMITGEEAKAAQLALIDKLEAQSAEYASGMTDLYIADTMTAPTGSKLYRAMEAGSYTNLKKADGSPHAAITAEQWEALAYNAVTDAWENVGDTRREGPAGPTGTGGSLVLPVTAEQTYNKTLTEGQTQAYKMLSGSGNVTINGRTVAMDSGQNNYVLLDFVGGVYSLQIAASPYVYTTQDDNTTPIYPLSNLTAAVISSAKTGQTTATITLISKDANATAHQAQISTNGTTWDNATGSWTGDVFSATGLTAGTLYHSRVISSASGYNSATSNDSQFTTDAAALTLTAAVITAVKTGSTTATVTMTSKDANATTHTVQQSADSGTTWSNATGSWAGDVFSVTGLTASTTYQFRVQSTASGYTSATSNTVSITTDAANVVSQYITATGISGADATAAQNLYDGLGTNDLDDEVLGLWPFLGADLSKKMYNLMNPANTDAAHRMASTGTNTSVARGIQMSQGSKLNTFYKAQISSIADYPAIGFTWYIPQYVTGTHSMAFLLDGSSVIVNFNEAGAGAYIKIGGEIAPSYAPYIAIPSETVLKGAWTCQRTSAGKVQLWINGVKIGEKDNTGTLEDNGYIALQNPEAAGKIVGMYMMHKSYADADVTTLHTLINSFATATGKDV